MFGKVIFLSFYLTVLFNPYAYAGWPEDGWEGVPSLHVVHKGQTVNFDQLHQLLATEEEKVARALPPNDSTNIVLASISFLGGEVPSLHTYHLKNQEDKWLVFESGWASSFISNPVYDQAQKLMKPYAAKLQKEDLTALDKEKLVQDCIKVAEGQRYFEEHIRPSFHFFHHEPIPVAHILERVESIFSQTDSREVGYPVYRDLRKNRIAFDRVASELQITKFEAAQSIRDLSQEIDLSSGVDLTFIKEMGQSVKTAHDQLSTQEKEMSKIGSKVISTYWHSEQKLLKHIKDAMPSILESLNQDHLPFKPEAVFINVHSRHDICPVCSHTFVRSYTRPEGVLSTFRAALCERLAIDSQSLPLYLTSSFREKREKTKYAVREDRPGTLEDSITTIAPAFSTLYIPLLSHENSQSPISSSLSGLSSSSTSSR